MRKPADHTNPANHAARWLTVTVFTALAYWLFAFAADFLSLPGALTAIWPASGIAAFAILVYSYRALPGIVLGVYLNQLSWIVRAGDQQPDASLWIQFIDQSQIGLSYAVGNALEAVLMLYLIRRFCSAQNPLSGSGNVIRFIALAALASPIVGSLSGVLVTCGIWGWTPWADFWPLLWTWWVSAAAGILVVTPPLLFAYHEQEWPWQGLSYRWHESALLIGASCTVVTLAFYLNFPFEYLLLPILLWSAFRFGQSVTSWLGGILMLAVILITTHGYGPFSADTSRFSGTVESLTLLQCFVATLIATAMIVSAILAERHHIAEELHRTNVTLEERVAARTNELSVARSSAEAANMAKSRFIAAASHDLRQPLHTLRLFVDAMLIELRLREPPLQKYKPWHAGMKTLESTERSPPVELQPNFTNAKGGTNNTRGIDEYKLGKLTNGLESTLGNLHDLFENILDRSAHDVQAFETHIDWVDMTKVLESIELDIEPRVHDKGLCWHCECPGVRVRSDPVLLERILRNLLDNAVKYTSRGSISVRGNLVGTALEIVVADTGSGIPVDSQQAIFDEFYTAEPDGRSNQRSLGLGLSIVQHLCRLLQHELRIDSADRCGTAMTLRISEICDETMQIDELSAQTNEHEICFADRPSSKLRVLIVDHASVRHEMIDRLLQTWGYDVMRISLAAFQQARLPTEWVPDLLITTSSDTAPAKLLHTLSTGEPTAATIPIVVLGEVSRRETRGNLSDRGAKLLHLSNPVNPARLRSAIRSCLREP